MCLGGAIIAEVTSAVAGPAHTPTTVPEVVDTEEHTDDITDEETAGTGGGQQTTDTRLDEEAAEEDEEDNTHEPEVTLLILKYLCYFLYPESNCVTDT